MLITRAGAPSPQGFEVFKRRLDGVLVARTYVMMDYDMPADRVEEAVALTPGLESPTVSPLHREGWVAVRAMVPRDGAQRLMDDLYEIGARGDPAHRHPCLPTLSRRPAARPSRCRTPGGPSASRIAVLGLGRCCWSLLVRGRWIALDAEIRAQFTPFQRITLVVIGLLLFGAYYALVRSTGASPREAGLTVVNGYRKRTYEWSQVIGDLLRRGRRGGPSTSPTAPRSR